MGLFSTTKEMRTQLFFRDDNKFQFIKREVKYSCLIESKGEELIRAWKHFYCNQFYFPGYKNIPADNVTLGFTRDIILDPFNKIPTGESTNEKPKLKDSISLKKWIGRVATNQRHIYMTKRKSTIKEDIINHVLLAVLVVMIFGWVIRFASG